MDNADSAQIDAEAKIGSLILTSSRNTNLPIIKSSELNLSGAQNFTIAEGTAVEKLFLEGCRKFVIPKGHYKYIFLGNALDFTIMPGASYREIIGADPKLIRLALEKGKQSED